MPRKTSPTRRAPHALADIDRTLREAEALVERPASKAALRANLTETEIKRMAEYVYAKALAWDERIFQHIRGAV